MKKNVGRDTNTEIRIVVIMTAIAICALVLFGNQARRDRPVDEPTVTEDISQEADVSANDVSVEATPAKTSEFLAMPPAKSIAKQLDGLSAVTKEEKASLNTLASVLFEETRGPAKPHELVNRLVQLGYEPLVARDSNDYTGSMVIVRTKNALPGTRYFHAQFFSDERGEYYPQYVSFEFRPSQSMDEVVQSLENSFGRLGRPTTNDGVWMTWKLPNDYTLWIKRLDKQDLAGDPFNAYSAQDLNTLKVAIEKDVPGHEDDAEL